MRSAFDAALRQASWQEVLHGWSRMMNRIWLHQSKRTAILIAGPVLIAAAAVIGASMLDSDASEASGLAGLREAVRELQATGGGPAARVNGVDIPGQKLEAFGVLAASNDAYKNSDIAQYSVAEYLDLLIENELLYQEAGRRGLIPADEDVVATAGQTKAALLELMRGESAEAEQLRATFAGVEGTPYHIDVYDSSPEMLDGFRHSMAISRLHAEVFSALPDRDDSLARQAAVDGLVDDLRKIAAIEVLVRS